MTPSEAAFIAENPDGVPVLIGTSVPVHLLAALAEAGGAGEAARAYPSLSRGAISVALQYAGTHPEEGRPYPTKSLKRMLSELDLPDDVFDEPEDELEGDVSIALADTPKPPL